MMKLRKFGESLKDGNTSVNRIKVNSDISTRKFLFSLCDSGYTLLVIDGWIKMIGINKKKIKIEQKHKKVGLNESSAP